MLNRANCDVGVLFGLWESVKGCKSSEFELCLSPILDSHCCYRPDSS